MSTSPWTPFTNIEEHEFLLLTWKNLHPSMDCNYTSSKKLSETTYQYSNVNGGTVEFGNVQVILSHCLYDRFIYLAMLGSKSNNVSNTPCYQIVK